VHNLLVIAVDTLRPDHLGCYGYERATSPAIDRLAASADRFISCWSASNFTAPAFTSLFTGLYPNHHGVFDFRAKVHGSAVFDVLKAADVKTGGVVTFRFFQRLLEDIWGPLEAVTDTRSGDYAKDLPRVVTDGAVEWLHARDPARPFALFVHYDGPHMPYRLPARHAGRFGDVDAEGVDPELAEIFYPRQDDLGEERKKMIGRMFKTIEAINRGHRKIDPDTLNWLVDRYDDAVRYNDGEIGRLLRELEILDLRDDTVIALISDHGEELMDHGHLAHGGIHLYESTIRTACIVREPGQTEGRIVRRPISHVHLMPWLLRLAGAAPLPVGWNRPNLRDETAAHEPVFCIGEFKVAVRRGAAKLIRRRLLPGHSPLKRLRLAAKLALYRERGEELYDLAVDRHERRNVAARDPRRRDLLETLQAHLRSEAPAIGLSDASTMAADEKARIEKEMRDLGYM